MGITSIALGSALALGAAVAAPVALATPAAAAPSCSAGYVCLFNETDGADGLRVAYQYRLSTYVGQTYYGSAVALNDSVEAVFYNFQRVGAAFYHDANYAREITRYYVGQQGFRNWTPGATNSASSHNEI